jgi:hypothetical protein
MLGGTACEAGDDDRPSASAAPEPNGNCAAGSQVECACSDGSRGVTTCDASGQTPRACMCRDAALPPGATTTSALGTSDQDAGAHAGAHASEYTFARDIRITQIALYQAVKVPLMADGEAIVERNAPVVAGKAALMRVFIEPQPGFVPRDLIAVLDLVSHDEGVQPLQVRARVAAGSIEADLTTTLNLEMPAGYVTDDVRYAVSLCEGSSATPQAGAIDPDVRWPGVGADLIALGAREAGPLHVMIVPYRYLGDGSGRLPDIDDAELENYRERLRTLYPASVVDFELHDPVDYDGTVEPEEGWDEWLDFHCALRANEHPDPKLIYYGAIAPADSWVTYGGGIVGISNVPGPASNYGRCSVGIGFAGAENTVAHELGHALGLPHAPCGTSGAPYPYADAKIGVWGYAADARALKDPALYYDMMSYCDPPFISDFNFQRLFERIRYLNLEFDRAPVAPTRYVRVLVSADGHAVARGSVELDQAPGDSKDMQPVSMLGADGTVASEADAYFVPFSNAPAGVWLVPDTGASAVRITGLGTIGLR